MHKTNTAQSLDVNGPEKYFVNNSAIELCFTPDQGRFMRSKRLIKSGEIVLTVDPYAIVAAEEFRSFGCYYCMSFDLNTQMLIKCDQCNNVWYCSTKCREDDAELHAPICAALKALIRVTHIDDWTKSTVRLLLCMYLRKYIEEKKCIIHQSDIMIDNTNLMDEEPKTLSIESVVNNIEDLTINNNSTVNTNNNNANNIIVNNDNTNQVVNSEKNNSNADRTAEYELSWKDVSVLISNRTLFSKGNISYFNDLRRVLLNITHKAQLKLEPNENFTETMCQLIQNGFGVRKYGNYCYGYAIYPVASYFNHSCWPNLVFDQQGKSMHFIALHDIPEHAELNISYIPLNEPTAIRQKKLMTDYHFKCLCAGCRPRPKKEISKTEEKIDLNADNSATNNTKGDNASSEELYVSQKRKKKKSRWIGANNAGNNRHRFLVQAAKENNKMVIEEDIELIIDEFQRDFVCQFSECEGKGLIYLTKHGQRLCNLCLRSPVHENNK